MLGRRVDRRQEQRPERVDRGNPQADEDPGGGLALHEVEPHGEEERQEAGDDERELQAEHDEQWFHG